MDLNYAIQIILLHLVVVQLLMSCFSHHYRDQQRSCRVLLNRCLERFSSVLCQATFSWCTGLIRLGRKRALELSDLWDLAACDQSHKHAATLKKYWEKELNRDPRSVLLTNPKQRNRPSLTRAVVKTVAWSLFTTAYLRIITDLTIFVIPQVLRLLIAFISDKSQERWIGFVYVLVMLTGSCFQIVLANQYFYRTHRSGMHVNSALVSLLFQKALKLSNTARHSTTVGMMVNLLSDDSQKVADVLQRVQILWSAPLQICLAVYFLWDLLGPSSLAGLAAMVVFMPVNSVLMRMSRDLLATRMKHKDIRIKLMNEIITCIKTIKLNAWESSFQDKVLETRERELETLMKASYVNAFSGFVSMLSPFLVASLAFTTYIYLEPNNDLDSTKAFVSLSLFYILRQPVSTLPDVIAAIIQTQVSVKRLTEFLSHEELDPENIGAVPFGSRDHTSAMTIMNGTFTWDSTDTFCLRNISVDVREGQLLAIVGSVGAGKTSLCNALMGLMKKLQGTVTVNGSIAYVSQQAWIQNLSLRENIIFGKTFDDVLFQSTIDACALRADLQALPAGDLSGIGERGTNLSGGQKQRISLARAVYADADIYVLDDPLSSIDANTGKHIFEKVLGPKGILKTKTRIFVTNTIGYLTQADRIVVLSNGMVSAIYTGKEFLHADGLATLVKNTTGPIRNGMSENMSHTAPTVRFRKPHSSKTVDSAANIFELQPVADSIASASFDITERETVSVQRTNYMTNYPNGDNASEQGGPQWSVYVMYLKHLTAPIVVSVCCLFICSVAAGVGSNFWFREWSDVPYSKIQTDLEWKSCCFRNYILLGWIHALLVLMASLLLSKGQIHASRKLHASMLRRVLRAPMSFFDTFPVGQIISRFTKDVDAVDTNVPATTRAWLNCVFSVLATILIICLSTPLIVIVILPLGTMYVMIQRFFLPTGLRLKRLESVARSQIYSFLEESMAGRHVILATNSVQRFVLQNERLIDRSNAAGFLSQAAEMWLSFRVELIGTLLVILAGLVAVVGRDQEWGIDPKDIGLTVTYALSIISALNWLLFVSTKLEANILSVERINEYTDLSVEGWQINQKSKDLRVKAWPDKGAIEFILFEARYLHELRPALKGITCCIKGGEKVGVVGKTGAGKSTLALALFRIMEASQGAIFVDGVEISSVDIHDLRSRISIVPQDSVLFTGTIRFNLDPVSKFSEEAINNAVIEAHLSSFVNSLSGGLDYLITERGGNLSVGQRQKICLARVLLRNTTIIVLDESTSAMDQETDLLIQQTVRRNFAHCTVLTIAHRLETIMDSSRVMVMDDGKVKEFDSPQLLLQDRLSLFYGLVQSAKFGMAQTTDAAERLRAFGAISAAGLKRMSPLESHLGGR